LVCYGAFCLLKAGKDTIMTNMNVSTRQTSVVSQDTNALIGSTVKTWVAVFALVTLALMILQPTAIVTGTFAVALMVAIALLAHNSIESFDDGVTFDAKQQLIAILAPAHFACLIWMAVHAGRLMMDTSLVTSSLAAFIALAVIIMVDAVVSASLLLAAERGHGVSGLSIAALINGKYAGLVGKIA
jgi:hypothetical protein